MAIISQSDEYEKASDSQLAFIDNLIHTCELDEERKVWIECDLFNLSFQEAERLINFLMQHQKESLDQQFERKLSIED